MRTELQMYYSGNNFFGHREMLTSEMIYPRMQWRLVRTRMYGNWKQSHSTNAKENSINSLRRMKKMIIDLILDRRAADKQEDETGKRPIWFTGEIDEYDPAKFYRDVMSYGEIGHDITRALDGGTEDDVKRELCKYIINGEYNPNICGYIYSVNWLTNSRVKDSFGENIKIVPITFD